jgi:hypothetical protein
MLLLLLRYLKYVTTWISATATATATAWITDIALARISTNATDTAQISEVCYYMDVCYCYCTNIHCCYCTNITTTTARISVAVTTSISTTATTIDAA